MTDVLGTGIAFPLRVDSSGRLALASGDEDIGEAIGVILGCAPGERPMRPEFGCGVHRYVFETIDAHAIGKIEYEVRNALARWEPRIDVTSVEVDVSGADAGLISIDVAYRVRATSEPRNLVYPFYVIPEEEER
jgi:uncharacterized protein